MTTFCDRCGAPVGADDQRCRTCGWPAPVPLTPAERGEVVRGGQVVQGGEVRRPGTPGAAGAARVRRPADPGPPPTRPSFGVEDDAVTPSRILLRLLAVLVAAAVVALVGVSVLYAGVLRGPADRAPAGAAPRTSAAPSTRGATTSARPRPSASPSRATPSTPATTTATTATYPRLTLPGRSCGASGDGPWKQAAAGSSQTSCPFALAVQRAFLASGPAPRQPRTVSALSPVTATAYPMTCSGDQPVACTGGNGAVVYLYGGTATFH